VVFELKRNWEISVWRTFVERTGSRSLVLAHDMAAAALAFFLSLWFAFGAGFKWAGLKEPSFYIWTTVSFAMIAGIVFVHNNLHKGVWRYTSLRDLKCILQSSLVSVLLFFPFVFLVSRGEELPRASVLLSFVFLTFFLSAPRILFRVLQERSLGIAPGGMRGIRSPVYLVGVGGRAESFIREVHRDANTPFDIRGLIAPTSYWVNREVQGVPVVAALGDLGAYLELMARLEQPVLRIVIADEGLSQSAKDNLLSVASEHGISLGRLPGSTEIHSDATLPTEPKPIALEDLLHRPQKRLDRRGMQNLIEGKRVLVTGAGGSIGSELVRQLAGFAPAHISLVDNCEYNLYAIDLELSQSFPSLSRSAVLCDVRDRKRVARAFDREMPEIVFHAAAYKHVPLVEQNPLEGVRTNVVGTRNVADEAVRCGARAMVMISTDKAVNPTNVMGATKRLAEAYAQALDLTGSETRFVTVRFGNVLGSTGSVVPLFQKQIAAGGPVTVTHPDITRYFMTIPEAVQLVLQASVSGASSEDYRGKLFVLDMGAPVRIADLARQMIRLAGKRPDIDIPIQYVGLRPGEKLHEELLHAREHLVESPQSGLLLAAPRPGILQILAREIDGLEVAVNDGDEDAALRLLRRAIPEFISERTPSSAPPKARRLTLVRS